jgi:hypothetical protein
VTRLLAILSVAAVFVGGCARLPRNVRYIEDVDAFLQQRQGTAVLIPEPCFSCGNFKIDTSQFFDLFDSEDSLLVVAERNDTEFITNTALEHWESVYYTSLSALVASAVPTGNAPLAFVDLGGERARSINRYQTVADFAESLSDVEGDLPIREPTPEEYLADHADGRSLTLFGFLNLNSANPFFFEDLYYVLLVRDVLARYGTELNPRFVLFTYSQPSSMSSFLDRAMLSDLHVVSDRAGRYVDAFRHDFVLFVNGTVLDIVSRRAAFKRIVHDLRTHFDIDVESDDELVSAALFFDVNGDRLIPPSESLFYSVELQCGDCLSYYRNEDAFYSRYGVPASRISYLTYDMRTVMDEYPFYLDDSYEFAAKTAFVYHGTSRIAPQQVWSAEDITPD